MKISYIKVADDDDITSGDNDTILNDDHYCRQRPSSLKKSASSSGSPHAYLGPGSGPNSGPHAYLGASSGPNHNPHLATATEITRYRLLYQLPGHFQWHHRRRHVNHHSSRSLRPWPHLQPFFFAKSIIIQHHRHKPSTVIFVNHHSSPGSKSPALALLPFGPICILFFLLTNFCQIQHNRQRSQIIQHHRQPSYLLVTILLQA